MKLGLKSSVKDVKVIAGLEPAFLETFIFPRDLIDIGIDELVQRFGASGLPVVVHVPEYHGDVFVDLASADPDIRRVSVDVVRSCIELADGLHSPHIVLHPGGAAEMPIDEKAAIKRLRKSLKELSYDRFYLENMPWFYYKGRSRTRTWMVSSWIMRDVKDFADVEDLIAGMTLDTCHGYLSTHQGSMENLLALFDELPDMPRYLHISDAWPPSNEGLQLGIGKIDFVPVYKRIKAMGVGWLGIPEIMDGHKNAGKGFADALKVLRNEGLE